ncbi:MAG TPA: helix-turn-helix domain-containing protein [Candidatus Acidoferrum sp.]|nr:helix-turn-helix domain-containing protein [Candidatus Acidoferrum sp.]
MGFETVPDAWGRLWDLRELERRDFDAARDWWQSARLADGAYDEARDWWYGLTDEEREDIQSEYYERIYDTSLFKPSFDYHDVFNIRPADLFGKAVTGEDLRCKLSRRQVEVIRLNYPIEGVSLRQLARSFGVSPSTMWKVLHGHSWKD